MANYPGVGADEYSLESFLFQGDIPIVEFVEIYFDHDKSDSGYTYSPDPLTGLLDENTQTILRNDHPGVIIQSFLQDFYNRFHLSPTPVSFGAVLQQKTIALEIWNAFFTDAAYTSQITSGFVGLSLGAGSYPPPTITIPRFYIHNLPIIAEVEGPPRISATLQMVVTGKYIQQVLISGRRASLFPFATSWDSNPIEAFEYKTNIVETEGWVEYRYRNRAHPRRSFQLGVAAIGRTASDLRINLLGSQGFDYALPLWMYETRTTAQVLPGATVIQVDTTTSDFVAGESVMLFESPERFETVEVASVSSSSISIDPLTPVTETWPIGTLAYPMRLAKFTDTISISGPSGNVARAVVNLDSNSSETNFSSHQFGTYKGIPFMSWMPNWKSGGKGEYKRKFEIVDNGVYPANKYLLSRNFGEEQEFEWLLNGRAMVTQFKALMSYMAGRQNPIWMPTWHNEFPLVEPYVNNTLSLYVNSSYATKFLQFNPNLTLYFRMLTKDGTIYFVEVADAIQDPAIPSHDLITMADYIGYDIPTYWLEDCSQISLVRLASDSYEIEWYTSELAVVRLTLVRVPEQV